MAVLELSNIGKSFGKVPALRDVSLSVGSGEFICLLGGSGCGKTTLLRVIAGLEQHDKGEILLLRLAQDLEDYGKVEQMPKLEGKRMTMFIAPKKTK